MPIPRSHKFIEFFEFFGLTNKGLKKTQKKPYKLGKPNGQLYLELKKEISNSEEFCQSKDLELERSDDFINALKKG